MEKRMQQKLTLIAVLALALLTGCSPLSSVMVRADGSGELAKPQSNEAVVYFMRPSSHGAGVPAAVFRFTGSSEQFLGSLGSSDKMVTTVPAGDHVFMVTGPNGAHGGFMKAQLQGGKTYHSVVVPSGWPIIFFGLHPVKADSATDFPSQNADVQRWIADPSIKKLGPGAADAVKSIAARAAEFRKQRYEDWSRSSGGQAERNMLQGKDGN
jgi:hypothetical protein